MAKEKSYRTLWYVDPRTQDAQSVFNGNAFPKNLKDLVYSCATRTALILFHMQNMIAAIESDKHNFLVRINDEQMGLRNLRRRDNLDCLVTFDSVGFTASLHGYLTSIKSMLDIYAKLLGKLIHPNSNASFSKANVGSEKISGGKFIKWLRTNAPKEHVKTTELSNILEAHSRQWITSAVNHRDTLSHYSDITGMKPLRFMLDYGNMPKDTSSFSDPMMPDGQDVVSYCQALLLNFQILVQQTILLAPNTDSKLISPSSFLAMSIRRE